GGPAERNGRAKADHARRCHLPHHPALDSFHQLCPRAKQRPRRIDTQNSFRQIHQPGQSRAHAALSRSTSRFDGWLARGPLLLNICRSCRGTGSLYQQLNSIIARDAPEARCREKLTVEKLTPVTWI